MVGCFPTPFKKTYVINKKPLVNNGKDKPPASPPPPPRYSRIIDVLNPDGHVAPLVKIIEVRRSGLSESRNNQNVEKPVTRIEKTSGNGTKHNTQNGNIKPPKGTQIPQIEDKPINSKIMKSDVDENIYEETGKYPDKTISIEEPKNSPSQVQPKNKELKVNEISNKASSSDSLKVNLDTDPMYEQTEKCATPQAPTVVRPDREPAKLPIEDIGHKNRPTFERSKPKKGKAPTIEESFGTTFKNNINIPEKTISNDLTNEPKYNGDSESTYEDSIYSDPVLDLETLKEEERPSQSTITSSGFYDMVARRSGVQPVHYELDDNVQLPVYPKSEEEKNMLRRAIGRNDLLSKIFNNKMKVLNSIIDAMYEEEYRAKDIIIKQGDKGEHMYISAKGRYRILIKGKVFSEFSDCRVFGELAILHRAPRQATIKALTNGKVWVLDQQVYHQITVGHYIQTQDEILSFLMKNEKLKVAGKTVLQIVAGLLKMEFFTAGEHIVKQGDPGNTFYIIRSGTVTITREGEGVVGVYKEGDCFGELALLGEDKRQATVTADSPRVECLTLSREQFVKHFGEVESFIEVKRYENRNSVHAPTAEYEDVDIRRLRIVATLGVGGFGRVELAQHEDDKNLVFALKYLKKFDIVAQHQEEHVINERAIQMACRSQFIVRMYRTFKDNKFVFFLMEPCLGGDVFGLLQRQKNKRFEEPQARFISASVVEAFEYLHARGIIYRDLKPENLLIAENGYMKLTDFGFVKKMTDRGKTFTFAGTPEYVAPEIVLNRGHDRAVDYWTLGIFIYEMLRGKTPFRTDDTSHMKTYTKILSGIDNADFTGIPYKARNLIEKLCRAIPANRLGMQNAGIKDIKNHTWFLGFDWEKFKKCEMYSPFKLKLKSSTDTSLIDKFKKDADTPPDEMSGWDASF